MENDGNKHQNDIQNTPKMKNCRKKIQKEASKIFSFGEFNFLKKLIVATPTIKTHLTIQF